MQRRGKRKTKARATCETRHSHEVDQRTLARNTTRVEREPDDAEQTQKKMLCRQTLELSGGEAVRLERVVRPNHTPPVYASR